MFRLQATYNSFYSIFPIHDCLEHGLLFSVIRTNVSGKIVQYDRRS
jgi:hypothetical protein